MLGSSIKLSLLSRWTSKIWLREILCVKNTVQLQQNRAKTAVLTHADHIQHVIFCEQLIGMKRNKTLSLFPAHELSNDTDFVCLQS